ncbi:MAG: hypothetical protein ACRD72_14645, partial [Candidatus Angelobacter sp.]
MYTWIQGKGLLYFVGLMGMGTITAFNFWLALMRWGWASTDPVTHVNALLVAAVTELGLCAGLVLVNRYFYRRLRRMAVLWGLWAGVCIGFSLYVNVSYFLVHQQDVGGSAGVDLAARAMLPMALLIGFGLLPPKPISSIADVEAAHAVKVAEVKSKLEIARMLGEAKIARRKELEAEKAERVN